MIKTIHRASDGQEFDDLDSAKAYEIILTKKAPINIYLGKHRKLNLEGKKATEYRSLLMDFLLVWPELEEIQATIDGIG